MLNRPGCGSKKTRDIKTSPKGYPRIRGVITWLENQDWVPGCFANPAINLHVSPFFTMFSPCFTIFHHFSPFFLHVSPFFRPSNPPLFTGESTTPPTKIGPLWSPLSRRPHSSRTPRSRRAWGQCQALAILGWVKLWWFSWEIDGAGFSWWFHGDFMGDLWMFCRISWWFHVAAWSNDRMWWTMIRLESI